METFMDLLGVVGRHPCLPMVVCYSSRDELGVVSSTVATVPYISLAPLGAPLCTHYAQRGACKFGAACKFDHPMGTLSYSPSASSLTDMPVAPYPVGSSIGTLAPSSSSSELRPELNSGTSKDSVSARMSSSLSTVSGSVGSTVSKDGVAHLGGQLSAQGSGPSTTSDNSTECHSSS